MKVHWTDGAKSRLKLIEENIAQDAPRAARQTVRRLILRSRQIGKLPCSGRKVPEYDHPEVREVLEPYRIIFRIRSNQVDILTVMHNRQLLPGDIEESD